MFVSRALSHVDCFVSLLDQRARTKMFFEEVLGKTASASHMLEESLIFLSNSFDEFTRELKRTELSLRVDAGFKGGDWLEALSSLRSCETL